MTSLTRWDPFREVTSLHDAVNHLFDQAVMRPGFALPMQQLGGQMNIVEANGRYFCQFLMPGVTADDIELTVRQNTLAVKAQARELIPEETRKNGTYLAREFGAAEYTRAVTFPKDVNPDKVEARFENGVLTIEVPLAEHAQPRRIAISQGASSGQPRLTESAPTGASSVEASAGSHKGLNGLNGLNKQEPATVS